MIDLGKTSRNNGTVLAVTMGSVETYLTIALLLPSIIYTISKLIKLYKEK